MLERPFGRTGKEVSVVGFGGMRFPEDASIEACADIAVHANDLGVSYFDTAPGYGRSEEILGRAFRRMRNPWFVSTKSSARDGAGLRKDLETSLRRLGVDRIHFFHIWCVVSMDAFRGRRCAIDEALEAKRQGLIEHLCISSHQPGEEIREVVATGLFEGITLGYNALNFPFRGEGIRAAARAGLGVVTMNPLGGGLIPRHRDRFPFLGNLGRTPVEAALRFNLSHPEITVALVGFSQLAEVDEAVRSQEELRPFPPETLARLEEEIPASFDELCTTCGYCLPCPEGLPVPKLMESYNMAILEGGTEAAVKRMKYHWAIPPDSAEGCIDCGECEERCTQHLPIRERLARIRDAVGEQAHKD